MVREGLKYCTELAQFYFGSVRYELKEDPRLLHIIALAHIPCCLALSPDDLVVGVAMTTSIVFYSADTGALLGSLHGVHNGRWSGCETNGLCMRLMVWV